MISLGTLQQKSLQKLIMHELKRANRNDQLNDVCKRRIQLSTNHIYYVTLLSNVDGQAFKVGTSN